MPRSLFIATAKQTGGIERVATRLARGLVDSGVNVLFAAAAGGATMTSCESMGIPTVALDVRNSGDLRAATAIARHIGQWQPDVVHVHSRRDYLPVVMGLAMSRVTSKRVRSTRLVFHHHMLRPLGQPLGLSGRAFEKSVDRVIAVSYAVQSYLQQQHHLRPGFVDVIPNGVDMALIPNPSQPEYAAIRQTARRVLGVHSDCIAIGMLGRLDTKGQRHMVQILPSLLRINPNVKLIMVGSEGKDNYRGLLDDLALQLGVTDNILFTGHIDDVNPLLAAFDLTAHLPADEAFGLAIVEAMAAGLPVVASAIGGCSEIVLPGETGILIDRDDSRLSDAFTSLIHPADGPANRKRFGERAVAHVNDHYTLRAQVASVMALYESLALLGENAPPIGSSYPFVPE